MSTDYTKRLLLVNSEFALVFHSDAKITPCAVVNQVVICSLIGGKQITLKPTFATPPEDVLNGLRPFLEPLYEAFESAVVLAYELIDQHGWPLSPHLFSHIARAEVKKTLSGKRCPVEYDDKIRILQMDSVSMEGLSTTVDDITVKVFKGELLPPALSDAREFFYQHSNPNLFKTPGSPEISSLAVLWECDSQGKFLRMYLVCPKDASAQWLWRVPIPPPANWIVVSPSGSSGSGGGSSVVADSDLDVSVNQSEATETHE